MFVAAMAGVLVTLILALTRAVLGPTAYDRVLAVNMAGTKTVLLIAVLGFLNQHCRCSIYRSRYLICFSNNI